MIPITIHSTQNKHTGGYTQHLDKSVSAVTEARIWITNDLQKLDENGEVIALPAPEKGQIDNGCEGIDKLQDEGFEDEALLKALVCLWNL